MKRIFLKIPVFLLCLLLTLAIFPAASTAKSKLSASPASVKGIGVDVPTEQQIRDFMTAYPSYYGTDKTVEFDMEPNVTSPYAAGSIKNEYLQEGLNAANLMRYICGVPAGLTLDAAYTGRIQKGAVIMAANNVLTHTPDQPAGMDNSFYNDGFTGTNSSNIASGFKLFSSSIIEGYMWDGDSSGNIATVGHRRRILNVDFGKTGFGLAFNSQKKYFTGMYVIDHSGTVPSGKDYSVVAYPAQNMPAEFMKDGTPYSVLLSSDFNTPVASAVTVTMTRLSDGRIWNFSSADPSNFWVSTNGYGSQYAIIWKPSGASYSAGDKYSIAISGIKKGGIDYPISYNINYFSLVGEAPATPYIKYTYILPGSIKVTWDAVPGATGYEVYRGDLGVIASTADLEYKDSNVADGNTYQYQVRAYREFANLKKYSAVPTNPWVYLLKNPVAVPENPKNVKAEKVTGGIKLGWDPVSDATGYDVFRRDSTQSAFTRIDRTTGPGYTDATVVDGATYTYKIRAYILIGDEIIPSDFSSEVSIVKDSPPVTPAAPATPTGIKADSRSYNCIGVTWNTVAGATGYSVYSSKYLTGSYKLLQSGPLNSFSHTGLPTGTTYYYKVRAYLNTGGTVLESPDSAIVSCKPVPAVPASFAVKKASSAAVKISWKKVPGASGYALYRSTKSGSGFKAVAIIKKGSVVSCTNNKLKKGKTYYFRMRAYRTVNGKKVYGGYTSVKKVRL